MTGPDVGAAVAFLADLNRLLREGLVSIDHDGHELPPPCSGPRYTITPHGRSYVQDHDDQQSARYDLSDRSAPETTQRRTG